MINLIKLFRKAVHSPVFWLIPSMLIASVYIIPALKVDFWWVDDGWDIMVAQKLLSSPANLHLIFEEQGGRLRIVYWIYQVFEYMVGGINAHAHYLIHIIAIILTVYVIFKIVQKLTKSYFLGFISGIFYLLVPINTENLFRLGPQEPLLSLFVAAAIYFLLTKKKWLSIVFLFLATFTKEVGFALWMPVLILYLAKKTLIQKEDRILKWFSIWGILFSTPIIINVILRRTGYSEFYTFNFNQIISNFGSNIILMARSFPFFLYLLLFSFLIRIFFERKDRSSTESLLIEAFFLLTSLVFVVIQSPWQFVLVRYLMPATVGIAIFVGFELDGLFKIIRRLKISIRIVAFSVLFLLIFDFVGTNINHIYVYGTQFAYLSRFIQSTFKNLASTVPQDGVILYNFKNNETTNEFVQETKIQMGTFYGRYDINVDYLDINKSSTKGSVVVAMSNVQEEYTPDTIAVKYKNVEKMNTSGKNLLVFSSPLNIAKQLVKKIFSFAMNRKPFSYDGIVTSYVLFASWYKYQ